VLLRLQSFKEGLWSAYQPQRSPAAFSKAPFIEPISLLSRPSNGQLLWINLPISISILNPKERQVMLKGPLIKVASLLNTRAP